MFPKLPETTKNKKIIATHSILAECKEWERYGFIRFWEKRNLGIANDIDSLMIKYECIRDGYSTDSNEMTKFIAENRELMDRAFLAYE